ITLTDMIAFAATRTLVSYPELNSIFQNDTLYQYDHVHLALAVDTERGLMVPVVRFADLMSLNELAIALKELASRAKAGSINPDLLSGGTITLTNLGSFGIDSFTPVLNPPQVAILGVAGIHPKPVANADGSYDMLPHIGLSLTIDHQVVDGAPAAKFLQALVAQIENINLALAQ
ncbi:MAG: 2-oxo acid dehydrogenase subunit E2, partial [Chitinivibrionales bacterium]|nr:2-oxo acid dehydrogenase subunit E2 [Chitinivibrionales bacterium]